MNYYFTRYWKCWSASVGVDSKTWRLEFSAGYSHNLMAWLNVGLGPFSFTVDWMPGLNG